MHNIGSTKDGIGAFLPMDFISTEVGEDFFFAFAFRLLFHSADGSAVIDSIVLPDTTDLSSLVISDLAAYLSFTFDSNQAVSPLAGTLMRLNFPFRFFPLRIICILPL